MDSTQDGMSMGYTFEVADPETCRHTYDFPARMGGRSEVITTAQASYARGDVTYLMTLLKSASAAATVGDRWIRLNRHPAAKTCQTGELLDTFALKKPRRGNDSYVDGQKTGTLVEKKADDLGERNVTYHVAPGDDPHLVKIVSEAESDRMTRTTTLSDFNKRVQIQTPPADRVVQEQDLQPG